MLLDVVFMANTSRMEVQVRLGENRNFSEYKMFEVYLGASSGAFISPNAHAIVTILTGTGMMFEEVVLICMCNA